MSDYPVQRLRLIGAKLRSEIANERTVAEDAADEILRLRAENEKLRSENEKLVAQSWVVDAALLSECEENEKLRAALKRIAEQDAVEMALDPQWARRAAAAALKETGDE